MPGCHFGQSELEVSRGDTNNLAFTAHQVLNSSGGFIGDLRGNNDVKELLLIADFCSFSGSSFKSERYFGKENGVVRKTRMVTMLPE